MRPPQASLRADYAISKIIKGGWQLGGDHGAVEQDKAIEDMLVFYDAGVTTFDCADIYPGVEDMLGKFRQQLHKHRGEAALKTLRIHTKYVPDKTDLPTLTAAQVTKGIDRSLRRLNTERLDLVQFHWWDYNVEGFLEAADHLLDCQQQGKIDRIGVTNFDAEHLKALCSHMEIVTAQVQYSILDRRASGAFATLAREHNVYLFADGVLAGGFLTDVWLAADDPGFEFANRSLVKYRLIIEEFGGWAIFQELLQVLRSIADKHNVDIDTIALKVILDNPDVAAAIVGARYANRLPLTLRVFDVELDANDIKAIDEIQARRQGPNGAVFGLERDTTGAHGSIMKYNINSGDMQQLRHQSDDTAT